MERALRAGSAEETRAFAAALARVVRDHAAEGGLFIGLAGDLGAGKTTFVQGFASELATEPGLYVTSPTFAIAQPYPTAPPVLHMDLYRISTLEELEAIGYREAYFGEGVTIVEWFDRVPEALPPERLEIHLAATAADVREMTLRAFGGRAEAILEEATK